MDISPEALAKAEFRGPVRFYDGARGMARQDFECEAEPRFGYTWQRKDRDDKGRQFYTVDGKEIAGFEEASKLLALPVDPDSAAERLKRSIEEFDFSPRVPHATRALSEARCNGDAGPFATARAWMHRASHAWHVGINKFSDTEREAGREWPLWMYNAKHAAHETYRGVYLFEADRKADDDLRCALGTRCRDCPMLQQIEASMIDQRENGKFYKDIDDTDIDAAKVFTCITHVLTQSHDFLDGAIFDVKSQRGREFGL